jgi:hypothetical protein
MKLNLLDPECPDFAGGFKFAAAVVVIGLIVAASESPINWLPTTTPHNVAASEAAPAPADHLPSDYTLDAGEPTPHVEAF